MANVPLIANPIFPPVPDEPKFDFEPNDEEGQKLQKTVDALWKWMKDVSVQLKILFGSPSSSNSALTIPLVQAGTVLPFAGISANIPSGYLLCDGSVASQTQYASLFSAIGATWNTGGEGAGNFRLPDFQGRGLVGAGSGSGLTVRTVGQTGGEESHVLTTAELASHSHPVTDPGHSHGVNDPQHSHSLSRGNGVGFAQKVTGTLSASGDNTETYDFSASVKPASTGISINNGTTGLSTNNAGGDAGHNNMQPFGVVQWMIKY